MHRPFASIVIIARRPIDCETAFYWLFGVLWWSLTPTLRSGR
jgi:hypothetical protein